MAWQQLAEVKASMAQVQAELRDMDSRMDALVMTMQRLLREPPAAGSAGAVQPLHPLPVDAVEVVVQTPKQPLQRRLLGIVEDGVKRRRRFVRGLRHRVAQRPEAGRRGSGENGAACDHER